MTNVYDFSDNSLYIIIFCKKYTKPRTYQVCFYEHISFDFKTYVAIHTIIAFFSYHNCHISKEISKEQKSRKRIFFIQAENADPVVSVINIGIAGKCKP